MTDLEVLLAYLGTQWLPIPVKEAYDRVSRGEHDLQQEIERLKARMKPDAAYF
jgi:hypothetical protein